MAEAARSEHQPATLPGEPARSQADGGKLLVANINPPRCTALPVALRLDASVTAASGAAYLVAAGPLSELLGLSAPLLRVAGAGLLAFAAVVWLVATAKRMARPAPATVIAVNAAWAIGSVAAVLADLGTPTTAGAAWMIAQALVVAGFAQLQLTGLRRAER